LLANAHALWRWADREQQLLPVEGLPSERVEAIARAADSAVFTGIGSRLSCNPGSG
jgi:hypothetical protein